jgi:hypothetical protein
MDIEGDEKPSNTPLGIDILDSTAQIWWAGKQMLPGNKLGDHVGRNEKTKIVAKLQKKGGGAPQREAPISPEEHKAMMAYYHKRQVGFRSGGTSDRSRALSVQGPGGRPGASCAGALLDHRPGPDTHRQIAAWWIVPAAERRERNTC